jgi:cellulose synthase/poly-beta-1,6-N-acetylglucosamine synthase-like glycosyltransferase
MIEVLEALFLLLTGVMLVYLVRHYVFTLTVLRVAQTTGGNSPSAASSVPEFKPSVSVLIPSRDEERVIGRLLQRMVESTYPKKKMQVIIIDDASSDGTGRIAQAYAEE